MPKLVYSLVILTIAFSVGSVVFVSYNLVLGARACYCNLTKYSTFKGVYTATTSSLLRPKI